MLQEQPKFAQRTFKCIPTQTGKFSVYDACIGHCHRDLTDPTNPDRYPNFEAYACNNFDPVVLADNFGANREARPRFFRWYWESGR